MSEKMWAIGFKESLPIEEADSLVEFTTDRPEPSGHDLLVKVSAVSVNPIDIAVRKGQSEPLQEPRVLGFDAVGTVVSKGEEVTLFENGDRVFYAGSFKRAGSDSEYQLVDERIVGHAPQQMDDVHAAAMPLTSLTAWEALFEQLQIDPEDLKKNAGKTLLIINGAGGVGSVATQLAHLAGLRVIASASRPETIQWCLDHGADQTVNHRKDLVMEVRNLGVQHVDYILELHNIDAQWEAMVELIKPGGRIASITSTKKPVNLTDLKRKSVTFAWEWMFAKSYYGTEDLVSQHENLEKIAKLLDEGKLKSTMTKELHPMNVENIKKAHQLVESQKMMGKVVVK